tara:strand:- start:206 stop:460 length:255 start_codon:yes stop_codon:yes gene_type:complete
MEIKRKWFSQKEAAEYLGRSERTLLNMRKLDVLVEGTCWMRKIPKAKNSHCLYDLGACESVLNGMHKAKESDLLEPSMKKEVAA